MTSLNNQHKQLLFDYCLGLTSPEEAAEAESLISSRSEASRIQAAIKAALSPLDALETGPCPDELVEGTIWRVNNAARSSQLRLEQLLAGEQARGRVHSSTLWHNLGRIAAVAAIILFAAAVLHPTLSLARQKYWRQRCQGQLAGIFQGLRNYVSEHDGQMPTVATAAGEPWWWVGYQGPENRSTTRASWVLVKNGYIHPSNFVCRGRAQTAPVRISPEQIKNYNDFPGRSYISYSVRIRCSGSKGPQPGVRKVLMADLSPLFEELPKEYTRQLKLELDKSLLLLKSINHGRRGQNVLFCDGSIEFVKTRYVDISHDDIFTLREMSEGCKIQGYEVPSCETDTFLAP
ncbi:MAG: hypothetical protein ACYTBJ_14680 [Planctomycetota bacterium]|jgi:hypothetical protein